MVDEPVKPASIKCKNCDKVNPIYRNNCSECGSKLGKRKQARSKKSIKKSKIKKSQQFCRKNKVTFQTKRLASRQRRTLFEKDGRMLRIYYCPECKGYHLTKVKQGR